MTQATDPGHADAHGGDRILRGLSAPSQVHLLGRRPLTTLAQERQRSDPRSAPGAQPAPPVADCVQEARDSGRRAGFAQGMQLAAGEHKALSDKLARDAAATLEAQLRQARETAQQQAAEQFGKQFARLQALLEALPAQIDSRMEACVEDMLDLCMDILGRCFSSQPWQAQQIAGWVRSALEDMRARPVVAVHLHPDDLATIEQAQTVFAAVNQELASGDQGPSVAQPTGQSRVQWVADPALHLGGCMLKSPQGGLDARMQTRLRLIAESLQRTRAGQVAAGGAAP